VSTFNDHFSGHAESYAQYRPGYPDTLFRLLADSCSQYDLAWDCATGNGQAARGAAPYFRKVIGTDASATQIDAATPHEGVEFRVARAEDSGLPAASVNLITVAQAVHWFDMEQFFDEAQRVLAPQGVLAFWCYEHCRTQSDCDPILDAVFQSVEAYWPPERLIVENHYRDIQLPLPEIDMPPLQMSALWHVQDILGYFRTWSATQRCMRETGADPVAEYAGPLEEAWGEGRREVIWPITLKACRKQ
jgi:SAM-dependent methyltransferase